MRQKRWNNTYSYRLSFLLLLVLVIVSAGCSTKKNTKASRFYHALTTRYNVYFNGNEAYKAGLKSIETGNKDNYMETIPLYPIGNKSTVGQGSGSFDRAIEKSQKAVTLHSIKRKPIRKPGKKYTAEYKKWLARKEFNPFLHNAWMLMGKAQYQKGDFAAAAATFAYIARLYDGQPKITADARIWLARCYTEQGWYYDAEDVLQKVNNDSLPLTLSPSYSTAYGHFLIGSQRYREAIPYLQNTIKSEKNKRQKARQYFLLGQIYQILDEPQNAYQAYGKVINQSPPYELELNARIRQTEVTSHQTPASLKKVTNKLQSMAKADKNKDYLDQIYYALGNIYLAEKDTTQAIKQYHLGVEKSTRGGIEKGILLLTLGNLYWEQGKHADAQTAYADAIGLLDKLHHEYKETVKRSEILDELVPYSNAVELQDSLQHLASLSEEARMVVIDTLIARFIRKDEAEKAALKAAEREQMRDEMRAENEANNPSQSAITTPIMPSGSSAWYFYNAQTVNQGKNEFQRTWGKRKLEDNWRRRNKTVVALDEFEAYNYDEDDDKGRESLGVVDDEDNPLTEDGEPTGEEEVIDERNPQFYLQQIPLTEEAMEASNEILSDGLFNMAMIFKDKLEDYPRADHAFSRLIRQFPEYKTLDEAYYNYFLMLGRTNRMTEAELTKQQLIVQFPESKYAITLADPDFAYNAVYGKHLEDSLYAATYNAYQVNNLRQVVANAEVSSNKYPMGQHRPKFIFLNAVANLQNGNQKAFLDDLRVLVQNYPENEITDIAAHILKGVKEGRLLAAGNVSFGGIWGRRSADLSGSETSLDEEDENNAFNAERNMPFLFILAYEEGKVNENQLLYEVARYNFSSFMVKNFDLAFEHDNGIGRLVVKEFANMDEALYYQRQLYTDAHMNEKLSGMRSIIISEANYELLNKYYSFDDYDAFYKENFQEADSYLISEEEDMELFDGSTLDDPIMNLPQPDEDNPDDDEEEEGEELEEGKGIYYIY